MFENFRYCLCFSLLRLGHYVFWTDLELHVAQTGFEFAVILLPLSLSARITGMCNLHVLFQHKYLLIPPNPHITFLNCGYVERSLSNLTQILGFSFWHSGLNLKEKKIKAY